MLFFSLNTYILIYIFADNNLKSHRIKITPLPKKKKKFKHILSNQIPYSIILLKYLYVLFINKNYFHL